jgi:hypothetical protein
VVLNEAMVGEGLLTVKGTEFDIPEVGGGFCTEMEALLPLATSAGKSVMTSCVELMNWVTRAAVVFQYVVAPGKKLLPFTVSVSV